MKMFYDFLILALMGLLLFFAIDLNDHEQRSHTDSDSDHKNGDHEKQEFYWGVDSASYADEQQLQCVNDHFGQPEVWGRYLGNIKDVSQGLTESEVESLHKNNIRILLIYNHFSEAAGYDNGVQEAKKAVNFAHDLSVPKGVAIFGDIEPEYKVNADFIQGWYDTLTASKYHAGLYGVFSENSSLLKAYNSTDKDAQKNTVVWTASPQKGVTAKKNAPSYNPDGPDTASIYGWQYGIDAKRCDIDTNLFKGDMQKFLWLRSDK